MERHPHEERFQKEIGAEDPPWLNAPGIREEGLLTGSDAVSRQYRTDGYRGTHPLPPGAFPQSLGCRWHHVEVETEEEKSKENHPAVAMQTVTP